MRLGFGRGLFTVHDVAELILPPSSFRVLGLLASVHAVLGRAFAERKVGACARHVFGRFWARDNAGEAVGIATCVRRVASVGAW